VFAVPRLRKCISSLFIKLMNLFGHEGGFDLILQNLSADETAASEDAPAQGNNNEIVTNKMDLNILGILVGCVSNPYLIYHKDFIAEYGPKFVEICIKRLRDAPEKSLRDVRRERIEGIIKSIDCF
jgi:hypothetical protein